MKEVLIFGKHWLIGILNMIELNVFLAVFFLLHLKIDADSKFYNWNNISKEEKLNILKEIGRLVKIKKKVLENNI